MNTPFMACVVFTVLITSVGAADKPATGLTSADKPDRFNLRYDNAPLKTVLGDISKHADVNIVTSAGMRGEVTCNLTDVELLPALRIIVESLGYSFHEQIVGSGVYTIRHRTAEEERAASLRRFYEALRREGFTEDQGMQILLRRLEIDEGE